MLSLPRTSAPCRMLLLALFLVSEFYSSQIGLVCVCVSISQTPILKSSMIDSKTESSDERGPDNTMASVSGNHAALTVVRLCVGS